jgi:hypothetical protein
VDIAKGVLLFPVLETHDKRTALAYVAAIVRRQHPWHRFEVVI